MKKRLDTHNSIRALVILLVMVFAHAADASAQSCRIGFSWENRNRHVYGDVTAECTGVCPPEGHSDTWGNWGVDSVTGSRSNGTQFFGWKSGLTGPCSENISSSQKQWNSCTTNGYTGWQWFNHNNYTEQWSGDARVFSSEALYFYECPVDWNYDGEIDDGGCGGGTGWRNFQLGQYMRLYELDGLPWPGDDFITQLDYPGGFVVPVWCDGWSCDAGNSGWRPSASNSTASAEVRVSTPGGYWNDPNGCCSNGVNYCD